MNQVLFYKELFIPSTIDGLNNCLHMVDEVKEKFNLNFDTVFALHTIIVESVENAFIHGNKGRIDAEVRVYISVSSSEIFVEVEDVGNGFDLENIPMPSMASNIENEGGRGVFFIKTLSNCCYTVGKGNIIRIKLNR
jgi:serine/threonine-protein kinase RsbW